MCPLGAPFQYVLAYAGRARLLWLLSCAQLLRCVCRQCAHVVSPSVHAPCATRAPHAGPLDVHDWYTGVCLARRLLRTVMTDAQRPKAAHWLLFARTSCVRDSTACSSKAARAVPPRSQRCRCFGRRVGFVWTQFRICYVASCLLLLSAYGKNDADCTKSPAINVHHRKGVGGQEH